MFITLLVVTFLISLGVSFIVARIFAKPIDNILKRIISDAISQAWVKYLTFAIYVVGVSSGVRIWELEKYITPPPGHGGAVELTRDRWVLEVYRTVVESLKGLAWLLLVFFVIALIAFVIVRAFELRKPKNVADAGQME
jgi:membrane associated rhomboid family serine protease